MVYDNKRPVTIRLAPPKHETHNGIVFNTRCFGGTPSWRVHEATVEWPAFLQRISRLHIVIHPGTASWWMTPLPYFELHNRNIQINHVLYDLLQLLSSREKAPDISLSVTDEFGRDPDSLSTALNLLSLFPKITKFEATNIAAATVTTIQTNIDREPKRPARKDQLRKIYRLEQQLKEEIKLAQAESVVEVEYMTLLLDTQKMIGQAPYRRLHQRRGSRQAFSDAEAGG